MTTTPRQLGCRWPPEWARQESVWLAWPHDETLWPTSLEPVWETFARLILELSCVQRVDLLVQNDDVERQALQSIHRAARKNGREGGLLICHRVATDDCWLRDSGPIFIEIGPASMSEQAAVGWDFNGWGKFEPFENDAAVPNAVAGILGRQLFVPGVILEGGAIDGNGRGVALTTEQCLLNPNRNPGIAKADWARLLADYLAIDELVWLGEGLVNDHTDGHVDVASRFVATDVVATTTTPDRTDPNFERLADNLQRLRSAVDLQRKAFRIVELPLPEPVEFAGARLAAGYANFVIANDLIVMPIYGCAADESAQEILQGLFPTRRVIGLNAVALLRGGGAFHCVTQQQPAPRA